MGKLRENSILFHLELNQDLFITPENRFEQLTPLLNIAVHTA